MEVLSYVLCSLLLLECIEVEIFKIHYILLDLSNRCLSDDVKMLLEIFLVIRRVASKFLISTDIRSALLLPLFSAFRLLL